MGPMQRINLNPVKPGGILPKYRKAQSGFHKPARVYKLAIGEQAPRTCGQSKMYVHEENVNWLDIKNGRRMIAAWVDQNSAEAYDNLVNQAMADQPQPRSRFYMRTDFTIENYKDLSTMSDKLVYWIDGAWCPPRPYVRTMGRLFKIKNTSHNRRSTFDFVRVIGKKGKDLVICNIHNIKDVMSISRYKLKSNYEPITI